MTIKEIARIANVSASTVSKIINGKHENISDETCARVMRVVKEYNYVPYAKSLAASESKTLLIGILLRGDRSNHSLLSGMIRHARNEGYGTLVCISENAEEERKNISLMCAHRVDGVLWEQITPVKPETVSDLTKRNIPFYTLNADQAPSSRNLVLDFSQIGYLATKKLVEAKHYKMACITPETHSNGAIDAFRDGFKKCLYEHNIPVTEQSFLSWKEKNEKHDDFLVLNTGFVCFNFDIATQLLRMAQSKNYRVPYDFSIVGVSCEDGKDDTIPALSSILLPYYEWGEYCCRKLVASIEKGKPQKIFRPNYVISHTNSIDVPITVRNKRIVVVGALNTDTLVNVNCFPKTGETTIASGYAILPGGKGTNQAIGAAKLGAEVCLIGKRGKDFPGNALMNALLEQNIDVSFVKIDDHLATGQAYIYVQENGESSIVIYEGANRNLMPVDIQQAADSFRYASFCLLQTELRRETVECAAHLAKVNGAKVLLKPAAITEISDSLLKNVDIFMPNLNELTRLCPDDVPIEEKAQRFLDRGVQTVIVTLADKGCYLRDKEHSEYFPAADFVPVDTTGAADAFAATLAVYLTEGKDITVAIRYANYAAGLSITRQGVPPALVDKSTLELYLPDIDEQTKRG